MFDWLRRILGPSKQSHSMRPRARYDAATPATNAIHFLKADDLGPNSANSADVRMKLRRFAGYEIDNNSYAKGMNLTSANEIVGTGPRLQMKLKSREDNRRIESEFSLWMLATGLADTLHTGVQAKTGRDGEFCAYLTTNPGIDHPVQLDVRHFEAAMLTTPGFSSAPNAVDGIEFDQHNNPTVYHVLKEHPGDGGYAFSNQAYNRVPARNMLHWFRVDRPGQYRGIPEITPSIGLFAQLRRYGQSVLTAAEVASNLAAVLQTDGGGAYDTEPQSDPWDQVPIDMGTMTTLPPGWKMAAFTPTQPIANYGDFKREVLMEIARCQNMPYNVVAGDSSRSNYASGRLDFQSWRKSISVTRASFVRKVLERIFYAWLAEAVLIPNYLPALDVRNVPHAWFFDGAPHVDPVKEATADKINLANCTTTLAAIYAEKGLDWEEELEQKSIEDERMQSLGLERYLPGYAMDVQKEIADENGNDQQDDEPTTEPSKDSGNGVHLNGFHFVGRSN